MPAAPRGVYVELRSDNPRTRIDRIIDGATMPVCVAPCQKVLDPAGQYVIEGDGVRATSRFVLPDDRDAVTLNVRAGSTSRLAGGVILLGAGIVTAYIGAMIWDVGALSGLADSPDSGKAVNTGKTMVIIGLPVALLGVFLTLSSHTTVTSSTGSTFTLETPSHRARSRIALTARGLEF